MKILFLFLDGIGLGSDDPAINPFAKVEMPNLQALLMGNKLVLHSLSTGTNGRKLESDRGTLIALDAGLGVGGMPQSATGQAVLLTGENIPAKIGQHYGPKPNKEVAAYLRNGNIFSTLASLGYQSGLINAYPQGYFDSIQSGRRLYSAIPLAVTSAGIRLKTQDDLIAGKALSADFTAVGWRERLNLPETPVLTPEEAGERMALLAEDYDLAFFEYWLSDYAGHSQDMQAAENLLKTFDRVLGGLLKRWDDRHGLILITSDHGNMEDLSTRRHTRNPVPALLIGAPALRGKFVSGLTDLTGITPAILRIIQEDRVLPNAS
ncbi:MAG: alkaline phosphatase family protein [Anaerolineales bacterium]